ncbi:plant invertase/pectin methylesterase inhibitor [Striga asiatica]|uniref:Plant invertase/pectin methylesterase inhibitor n=1 Tax=Striga asiatica TaxID=4170 RepID=A0A5A7PXZ3_STRAF|nr:plant invertase/pectin methylesterase inhibitor [Striga asiatica]
MMHSLILTILFIHAYSITTIPASVEFIRSSCDTTLHPDVYYRSLSLYVVAVCNPSRLTTVVIRVSLSNAARTSDNHDLMAQMPNTICRSRISANKTNLGRFLGGLQSESAVGSLQIAPPPDTKSVRDSDAPRLAVPPPAAFDPEGLDKKPAWSKDKICGPEPV